MKNRKRWGVYLMGVILALQTAGCGSSDCLQETGASVRYLMKEDKMVWKIRKIYPLKTEHRWR